MGSTVTDRIAGVSTSVAIKAPVKAITQGNIALSGLGVQGGGSWTESLTAGDRVLVKNQADATENGVYTAFTSEWRRATDFNGYRDVVKGTSVPIESTGDRYRVVTENPIVIGTSEINFQLHPQDARVIPVLSRESMKAFDVPAGSQFSLDGYIWEVISGTPPSDPQEATYVVLDNGNYAQRLGFLHLPPEAYGMKHSDGAFDNFPLLKAALESGNVIEFPKNKTYTCLTTGEICAPEIKVIGNGSTLAFDPSLAKGLHIQGNVLGTTTLASDAGLFDLTIEVSDATYISTDTFLIIRDTTPGSFSDYRTAYTKGDILRVRDVSGATITLDGQVQTDVASANSQVVIVEPVKLDIDDLTVTKQGSGGGQTVWLDYLWDSEIKKVKGVHGAVSLRMKHLLDSEMHDCGADNSVVKTDSDGYGLSFLNCKNVTSYGGLFTTVNNHACDFSGGVAYNVQSSNVIVKDAVLLGGNWAASFHGDSEFCKYIGCTADGAILGGNSPAFEDGVINVNIANYFDSGLTSIPAVRLTEMLTSTFSLKGNTVILSNDNKDPSSTIYFVQTIGGNMIGEDTLDGGLINVTDNVFRYIGDRDANTDGDFIGLQLGAASTASANVRNSTDITFQNNTFYFGSATYITAYQFVDFGSADVSGNNWVSPESDIRRRLLQNYAGDVSTDETMVSNLANETGVQQTLSDGVETTLYESAGTEGAFEIVSGVVSGKSVQIRGYSDGNLVYNPGQQDPRGETADGTTTISTYSIPRITGAKSVKITAEAYGGNRVCGWSIVHKT